MVYEVGKYNVSFEGIIYNGEIPYEMTIIQEFNGDMPINNRKVLYLRKNMHGENQYIIPEFKTESEVRRLLSYPNYARIAIRNTWVTEWSE